MFQLNSWSAPATDVTCSAQSIVPLRYRWARVHAVKSWLLGCHIILLRHLRPRLGDDFLSHCEGPLLLSGSRVYIVVSEHGCCLHVKALRHRSG
eukprot:9358509-Pyramimonas_sp.AAC.1